ncbi:unnamed protein product [Caenorhabditis bovis]|uniref:Uncharacterized protein n=1 Tax=Caenorhabditis bovis TaxID=2654633 RepID=A0A8S1EIV5_9PELO|nr:unnamed protein product [Caenorhabditis bovis]
MTSFIIVRDVAIRVAMCVAATLGGATDNEAGIVVSAGQEPAGAKLIGQRVGARAFVKGGKSGFVNLKQKRLFEGPEQTDERSGGTTLARAVQCDVWKIAVKLEPVYGAFCGASQITEPVNRIDGSFANGIVLYSSETMLVSGEVQRYDTGTSHP